MNPSHQSTALLYLHAQTSLHPGSGTALGVVDLPIQRERHTDWPLIPGTSLKGVLRDACGRAESEKARVCAAFGPETGDADKHAGAISITDARILAFPVRSLRGVFAWVTCPAVLERYNRDARLAGRTPLNLPAAPAKGQVLVAEGSPLIVDGSAIVLEEFEFQVAGVPGPLSEHLSRQMFLTNDQDTPASFQKRLAILHDDDFTHFVRHATEVVARIGLDAEKKTVKKGALFYQEFLPPETLLYAVVFANASRSDKVALDATAMMDYLRGHVRDVMQIGGDETTGKGLCGMRLCNGKEGA